MSTTTTDVSTTVDRYIAIWNETDPIQRRSLIASALSDDISYVDPMLAGDGHDGFDALIVTAQQQMPGHLVRLLGPIDSHHDRVRFSWEVVGPDGGGAVVVGTDYGVVAPDGRLRSLTGFFDLVPG